MRCNVTKDLSLSVSLVGFTYSTPPPPPNHSSKAFTASQYSTITIDLVENFNSLQKLLNCSLYLFDFLVLGERGGVPDCQSAPWGV